MKFGGLRCLCIGVKQLVFVFSMLSRITAALCCLVLVRALLAESEEQVYELPDYEVTAWHFGRDIMNVPADVVSVDRGKIERSLASSVPELLALEANLHFSTVSGYTNVAMRGFGENSGLRSLILVNGQSLNPSDMGRVNWEEIPLESIESIEVLRGGHNVLYGDKALAGVIKIETRREADRRLNVNWRVGSFGYEKASVNTAINENGWTVQSGVSGEQKDGYREHSATSARNAYLAVGHTFRVGDDLDLRFSIGESELNYPGGLSYEVYRENPQAAPDGADGKESDNQFISFTGRLEGERDWGDWQVLGGWDYRRAEWSLGAGSYGDNEQQGLNLKPRVRLWEGESATALILGLDLLYDSLDFIQSPDESRARVSGNADLREARLSPYFMVEREFLERLSLSSGLRYEWVRYEVDYLNYKVSSVGNRPGSLPPTQPELQEDLSFTEVVREHGMAAELSLNYRLNPKWSLWAGYDRVYRYPVFDERAAYQGYPLAEFVNLDLEAEEGDNFELGFKYIGRNFECYFTSFILKLDNEIIYDPNAEGSAGYKGLNVNLGPVDRAGIDAAFIYRRESWGASSRMAWIDTEVRAGEGRGYEVPLVPSFRVTNQFWLEPVESLRIRFSHSYVASQYRGGDFTNSSSRVENYHLFGLGAELGVGPNGHVFLTVENLLDELYAGAVHGDNYYPGDGRSVVVGVKLNF